MNANHLKLLCLAPALLLAIAGLNSTAYAQADVEPIEEIFEPLVPSDFSRERYVRVAVVQTNPVGNAAVPAPGAAQVAAYLQRNRDDLAGHIRTAAATGAEVVVTPEFGVTGYPDVAELPSEEDNWLTPDQIRPYTESVPGVSTQFFSNLARELRITIFFGLAERVMEGGREKLYNVLVAVGPDGEILGKHRKHELYHQENDFLQPGTELGIQNTVIGKVGMIVCADVYNSEVLNFYRANRVHALVLGTAWAQFNTGMGNFTRGARSCQAHLLAANQRWCPDSGVINPNGSKQSWIRQSEGIAYGYLPRHAPPAARATDGRSTRRPRRTR
jgi:predicted amidohydrolase